MRLSFSVKTRSVQLTAKEAIELGIWVSDYCPDADHLDIDFIERKIFIWDKHGNRVASRDFEYFK